MADELNMAGEDPDPLVYLNGNYCPLSEARVSVNDRGFQFADGVYEVVPVYAGRAFRLAHHLGRLRRSLGEIGMDAPMADDAFAEVVATVLERNACRDGQVYIQVTRGEAPRNHPFPAGAKPTVVVMANSVDPVPAAWLEEGVSAITVEDIRWGRCDIKSIALLPNVIMRQRAAEAGAFEALWVHDDHVMEGAASNVFAVIGGEALTPPDGPRVLPGITRDVVLELASAQGLPIRRGVLPLEDLRHAEEVWVTASTKEILPVTSVDGTPVGDGRPGTLFESALARYRERIQTFREHGEEP